MLKFLYLLLQVTYLFRHNKMPTSPITTNPDALLQQVSTTNLERVFVQRDFSEGTAVRFQTSLPQRLVGKVL